MRSPGSPVTNRTILKWALPCLLIAGMAVFLFQRINLATHEGLKVTDLKLKLATQPHPAGTAYLIEMDGMCDREHNDILIPALHTASGLEDASVSTMFGRREVQLEQPAGRVVIARWPGFASSLLHIPVAGVHWAPQFLFPNEDKSRQLAPGTWRTPENIVSALSMSDGFQAEARRERMGVIMRGGVWSPHIDFERRLHLQELESAKDVEGALVKVLDRFGGAVIYAECHDRAGGVNDLIYVGPSDDWDVDTLRKLLDK